MDETTHQPQVRTNRRSVMFEGAALGVGATAVARCRHTCQMPLRRRAIPRSSGRPPHPGDAAILRFLAAAEIIETDLWQQYNELAGIQDGEVPGGSGNDAYTEAVEVLDEDMPQYIHDNTDDEFSHVAFIDAYLEAHGEKTVNLDRFRTLPSSQAYGAQNNVGRLTNLKSPASTPASGRATAATGSTPTSGRARRRPSRRRPSGSTRRCPATRMRPQRRQPHAGDRQHGGLPLRVHRAGGTSLYAAMAIRVTSRRSFESCRASAGARSSISRSGTTRPAMRSPHLGGLGLPRPQCRRRVDETNRSSPSRATP